MLGGVKVLGCVLILRAVAASNVAAAQAKTEMDPPIAHLETLLTTARVRLHIFDLFKVFAGNHISLFGRVATGNQIRRSLP